MDGIPNILPGLNDIEKDFEEEKFVDKNDFELGMYSIVSTITS